MNLRQRRLWRLVCTLNLPYPAARIIMNYLDTPPLKADKPVVVVDYVPVDSDYADELESELRGYNDAQRMDWHEETWKFDFVEAVESVLGEDPFHFSMRFRNICAPASVYCGPEAYGYQRDWLDHMIDSTVKDTSNPWYQLKLVNAEMPAHVTRTEGNFDEANLDFLENEWR